MKSFRPRKSADDEAIEATAAAWLAQRDDGLNPDEEQDFARWRAADPRHETVVARFEKTWGALQRLRDFRPEARVHPDHDLLARSNRRKLIPFPKLAAAAAMAAALALVAVWQWPKLVPASAPLAETYATTDGGYQSVTLADGSILQLNSNSEVRVVFSPAERRIKLLRGEGNFTVAKNPARPFWVEAGAVSVRAIGTAFNVRMDSDKIEVLVTEGKVRVDDSRVGAPAARHPPGLIAENSGPYLVAGNRLTVAINQAAVSRSAAVIEKLEPGIIRAQLSWQEPRLLFVDTPLGEVIAQLNRRNRVQISLGDAELATMPIGGSFRPENLEAFVRLLATDNELVAERPDADRIVLRRRR